MLDTSTVSAAGRCNRRRDALKAQQKRGKSLSTLWFVRQYCIGNEKYIQFRKIAELYLIQTTLLQVNIFDYSTSYNQMQVILYYTSKTIFQHSVVLTLEKERSTLIMLCSTFYFTPWL